MKNEQSINSFLNAGLKLYFEYLKDGELEKANTILSLTSQIASVLLEVSGVRKTYTKYQDLNQETNYDHACMDQTYPINEDRSEMEN